jgi:transketolase
LSNSLVDTYGNTLIDLGMRNEKLVVLDADVSKSTKTKLFKDVFPDRFYNMGIAEQNLVGFASGLALSGYKPFVTTFAVFLSMRALEQIRQCIALPNLTVKLVASHSGISPSPDGASHQAIEDISLLRSIPNMRVYAPGDSEETREIILNESKLDGPCYIRLPKGETLNISNEININSPIYKKSRIVNLGQEVSIISTGDMWFDSYMAVKELHRMGYNVTFVHTPYIKPLDEALLTTLLNKTKVIITVENHSIIGGLGSAVSEFVSSTKPILVERIGMPDSFGESGDIDSLKRKYGLCVESIVEKAVNIMKKLSL